LTNSNAGIGKETILQLCKHSPKKVFLATRNEAKAKEAIASINSQLSQPADIAFVQLNLSNLASVAAAADTLIQSTDRIDLLFLNAGIMNLPPGKTDDGFDIQLGTNHVGHFLLTKRLLPVLKQTAAKYNPDVRILSVSSAANMASPSFENIISEGLWKKGGWTSYGASKAANILFAAELAKRYPEITSMSLHPGMIKTDLYDETREGSFFMRYAMAIVGPLVYYDVRYGALTQLWMSTAAKSKVQQGAFYTPVGKLQKGNSWANNAAAQKGLWEWTEEQLKERGF
jgi:NAD(P)-dependent dehydrogenase (short-subunit alcohol dehydrogenase family)